MSDHDLSSLTTAPSQDRPPTAEALAASFGPNAWMVLDLFDQYRRDPRSVPAGWQTFFQGAGAPAPGSPGVPGPALPVDGAAARTAPAPPAADPPGPAPDGLTEPLVGPALRLARNMASSLAVPTAASVRMVPARILEENRRLLNDQRDAAGAGRISFTHLVAWALLRALDGQPRLNDACLEADGRIQRVRRDAVRLGIAVDLRGRDGSRALRVPSIRDAGRLAFPEFLAAFDAAVAGARDGTAGPDAYAGTTVTLTNAGVAGTTLSLPRLMAGQGLIVATGALDYPAEYRSMAPRTRAALGIGKVMAVTSTYDHRIIQGAESGALLARLDALLQGEDGFYEGIFKGLGVTAPPLRLEPDQAPDLPPALGAAAGGGPGLEKQARLLQLIRAYRVRGHLVADLDPLDVPRPAPRELEPSAYGLSLWDLDREFHTNGLAGQDRGTLREILEALRDTYCRTVGAEYMFIQEPERRDWLQERMEACRNQAALEAGDRLRILDRLVRAEAFERFLHAKYVGHKRFSLEGCEALIPLLDRLLTDAARAGVEEAVLGMPHRGRLNVLANTVGKPLARIFAEFEGSIDPETIQGSGDVKYHLGAAGTHRAPGGESLAVTLAPNPSHLEAVNPVVEGMVRARQDRVGEAARGRYLPILMHGDAAFAGEGIVAETLNLAGLDGYGTGGTVHIVVNNQIGFTTLPQDARSSTYCTDVARMVQAPILHVNGDDPEAVAHVASLAFEYLARFRRDVVIDLVGYRRWGHNEGDEPSYTQPLMYARIRSHPTVARLYGDALVRKGVLDEAALAAAWAAAKAQMQEEGGQEPVPVPPAANLAQAPAGPGPEDLEASLRTALAALGSVPSGFEPHPKLLPFLRRRQDLAEAGGEVDWATAEALAFGTLVLAGTSVRLSGQDSVRGTFSQRHSKLYDVRTRAEHVPLDAIAARPAWFRAYDSLLSEAAVLGFEYGYAAASPETLTMWEAQFGDFANGAQVIIDNFMTSSESKWGQASGVVLLLPHGYEGQGPEHSSARIERFLQLCAEDNLRVCQPSTPASYFHLLRRQAREPRARPLVVFTPKSLLRHPRCVSPLGDLSRGGFEPVLSDADAREARRIVLVSGKLAYDLLEHRGQAPVALLRLEQLHPFPGEALGRALAALPPDAELVWAQEEPRNQGAWAFIRGCFLDGLVPDPARRLPVYAGRAPAAATATGSHKLHLREQAAVIQAALGPPEAGGSSAAGAGPEASASR